MNDLDRVKFLFGPYCPPPLKRGDRAFCLFRDCTVVVTSWTDARIPWPRCRPLDNPLGGSGLLVDEVLARAVRHESAVAICFWWRASEGAVWRWRKALGVTRTSSAGSRRLIHAAAKAGAFAVQEREFTDEECAQRSQRNRELGLYRNLRLGYHGEWWSARELALLGKLPDARVAQRPAGSPGPGSARGANGFGRVEGPDFATTSATTLLPGEGAGQYRDRSPRGLVQGSAPDGRPERPVHSPSLQILL